MFTLKGKNGRYCLSKTSIAMLAVLSPLAHAGSTGSVGNRVWMDANSNGIQDRGEQGASGVRVALMLCDSNNEIQSTVANQSRGNYSFSNLDVGVRYKIAVFQNSTTGTTGTIPSPFKEGSDRGKDSDLVESSATSDDPFYTRCFTVKADQIRYNIDMGLVPSGTEAPKEEDGIIGDHVFIDRNGDGQFTAGEGLQGATVTAYDKDSGYAVNSAVTNGSGFYEIELPAGCYDMQVELPSSIDAETVTYESTISNVCVDAGEENDTADFLINESQVSADPEFQCQHKINTMYEKWTSSTGVISREYYLSWLQTFITTSDSSINDSTVFRTYTTSDSLIVTSDPDFVEATNKPVITYRANRVDENTGVRMLQTGQMAHNGGYMLNPGQWISYPPILAIAKFVALGPVTIAYPDGTESAPISCTILPPYIHNDVRVTPVAFDMNGDGEIGVSGETTSPLVVRSSTNFVAKFDFGDGVKRDTEWLIGDGDALLVDNRDGMAESDMSGKRLFGDEQGRFVSGYDKLGVLDMNTDGVISGDELSGLSLWFDNGDAIVQSEELRTVQSSGLTSINVNYEMISGMMRSSAAMENGKEVMTEDVWFAVEEIVPPSAVIDTEISKTKARL